MKNDLNTLFKIKINILNHVVSRKHCGRLELGKIAIEIRRMK